MTATLTCEKVEELAPELALGQLPGHERAAVLAHLADCVSCRTLVEELSAVADGLLLLAPEDEPPLGFEGRVLEQLSDRRGAGRRRRVVLTLTGVAAVVLLGLAAVLSGATFACHSDQSALRVNQEYVATLRQLGGRSLRGAALLDGQGRRVGQAFMYDGGPSWVFVSVDSSAQAGTYMVVCTGSHAGPVVWPGLHVADGHGSVGWTVRGPVAGLDKVSVLDTSGRLVYHAVFDPARV